MVSFLLRHEAVRLLVLLVPLIAHIEIAQGAEDAKENSTTPTSDDALIRELGAQYVAVFNKHDAKALASYWSPDAVYTNRLTGEQVTGRAEITEQFATLFANGSPLKLDVQVDSIDFLSPNVAIEKGVATFVSSEEAPENIPYSAVYVKRDGKWLLDRVTDDPQPVTASNYEQLKPLEWMIGSWVNRDDSGAIQIDCNWTKNKNFMTRSFAVSIEGQIEVSGMQIIGWDAVEKRIRSWTFDSAGGFAEEQWSNQGDEWYVIKNGKTSNGQVVSAINVMTHVDDDTFKFKSVQRSEDGQLLPDSDEVFVIRE